MKVLYFYKYKTIKGIRGKYSCNCAHCSSLEKLPYNCYYRNYLTLDNYVTKTLIIKLNTQIFDFCKLRPEKAFYEPTEVVAKYYDFLIRGLQLINIVTKHETYMIGVYRKKG